MKKYKVVLITWGCASIPFIVIAFTKLDLDITQWNEVTRASAVLCAFLFGALGLLFSNMMIEEDD